MPQIAGKISRALPATNTDGSTNVSPRQGRRGELIILPGDLGTYPFCDEGSYFSATHQTPGTAVAYSVQATFSATIAYAVLRNTDAAAGKRTYLDYLKIIVTTVPASATSARFALAIDNANRVSSGGTAFTPQNRNMDDATASITSVVAGTPTIAAASGSVRYIANGSFKNAIPVIGDTYTINFGRIGAGASSNGTVDVGPALLGPGANHSILLHLWFPGNATTAGQFEMEFGIVER